MIQLKEMDCIFVQNILKFFVGIMEKSKTTTAPNIGYMTLTGLLGLVGCF